MDAKSFLTLRPGVDFTNILSVLRLCQTYSLESQTTWKHACNGRSSYFATAVNREKYHYTVRLVWNQLYNN
jgi:hypothetical protein